MALTRDDVLKVARLARLELNEEEVASYTKTLSSILEYAERINELDTSGVEPTSHSIPLENVMREDRVMPSLPREEALAMAPDPHEGAFRVPKIME